MANKVITTGEGGMADHNDAAFYQRAKSLRDHAIALSDDISTRSGASTTRITNLQEALGVRAARSASTTSWPPDRDQMGWYHAAIKTTESVRLNRVKNWRRARSGWFCLEVDGLMRARRTRSCRR